MQLTPALYRNSIYLFGTYVVFAAIAFWPQYLSDPLGAPSLHWHVHGFLMASWLALLVAQAYLIRSKQRELHRALGKVAYVLGPAVVMSIIVIAHFSLSKRPAVDAQAYQDLALFLSGSFQFFVAFSLAIALRHDSPLHARFMLCTPLALTGPIFNRVLGFFVLPAIGAGDFEAALITIPAVEVLLLGLVIWDWRSHRRFFAFPVILAAWLFGSFGLLVFPNSDWWQSFTVWFLTLPIS